MPLIEINVYIVHKVAHVHLKENVFKKDQFKCHYRKSFFYYSVGTAQGKIEASSLQENIQWHIKNKTKSKHLLDRTHYCSICA